MQLFSKSLELCYEEFDRGSVTLQVNYDDLGIISDVFMASPFGLVKVDLTWLEMARPTRYAYIQERVNEALRSGYSLEEND